MYDINGNAAEKDDFPLSICFVALVLALLLAVVSCTTTTNAPTQTQDALCRTLTNTGEYIYWYVVIDPETGAEYLVNNLGGATPRLDRDGRNIVVYP